MPLIQPLITTNSGLSFATNRDQVTLSGTADPNSDEVLVNGSTAGVTYTAGSGSWTAGPYDLVDGANVFVVQTTNDDPDTSPTNSITVTLLPNASIALLVEPPTGLVLERGRDRLRLTWVDEVDQNIRGYQVYFSREPGGGLEGYRPANATLISTATERAEDTQTLSETVTETADGSERTTTTVESVTARDTYELVMITDPDTGSPIDADDYYFVVTSVAYDSVRRREIESPLSIEVFGARLDFTPRVNYFDNRGFGDIVGDMLQKVFVRQPELDTKPLTFVRDAVIDPTSDEFSRLYAVVNFIHAAQSLLTLQPFDDPNNDGVSDSFTSGLAKTALRDALALDDNSTQIIIDSAFETLAVNYSAEGRQPAEFARGEATFYSSDQDLASAVIGSGTIVSTTAQEELGVEAVEFETLTGIDVSDPDEIATFYNDTNRRFEFTVPIRAREAGSIGNVPPNSIINAAGVPAGFRVTNLTRTDFGRDRETNVNLAVRALLGVAGVDSGTLYGYFRRAAAVPGVRRVKVVDAGHPLMFRDYDELREKHVGGAVDVYIQGNYLTQVEFQFAFQYPLDELEPVDVLDLSLLRFRVTNPDVTQQNPAFELTALRNVTKLLDFDVTNATIEFGTTFQLDTSIPLNVTQAALSSPSDVFVATYRHRQSNEATFDLQPVLQVLDVQGSISGDLNLNYNLYRENDPLLYGSSTEAADRIEIFPAGGIPASTFTTQTDSLTLFGLSEVSLSKLGVLEDTIVVKSSDGLTTYVEDVDYAVISGDQFTAPKIRRYSTASLITDGQEVSVTYDHGENVTVQYLTNSLLQSVDARINGTEIAEYKDATRHAAGDVLIKSVLETPADIRARIQVRPGFIESDVRKEVVANLSRLIGNLQLGEPLNQDRVIDTIRESAGVRRVDVPLQRLARQDEALVVREPLTGVTWEVVQLGAVTAYRSVNPILSHPTIDGGGAELEIAAGAGSLFGPIGGVEDSFYPLTPVDSVNEVTEAAGRIFISSDQKVTISPAQGGDPADHGYAVTYRVFNEDDAADLAADDLEVFVPGEISVEII